MIILIFDDSRNPPGGEIPNYSERSTPPSSLQNITEAGPEVSSYDWSRYGETAAPSGYAGVPIRDGRRTPTNGGLSDSSGRQSFESASPPGMTRVSSSGKISGSDKKKKPYWYNVSYHNVSCHHNGQYMATLRYVFNILGGLFRRYLK